ncbi:MAG: aminoacyl-tRNA hydrolase [Desulfovibrio sp.]|jgi:PTH1 family peptidyl-tRNA hydrolase|nr:aminoacyl-tRNA hydrolase [Desulfovibrio sp.]
MDIGGLIVGLGNPGTEYSRTRHNLGFMVLERLLQDREKAGVLQKLSGRKNLFALWKARFADADGAAGDRLLCEPLTFMNASGEAVRAVSSYYRILPERILVVHDELDLPPGRMKMKKGGGSAGHKGVESITQCLGTPDFFRLRIGIGKAPHNTLSFVLGRFSESEAELMDKCIAAATESVLMLTREGAAKAQQFCNSFSLY